MLPEDLKQHATFSALDQRFPEAVTGGHSDHNEPTLYIRTQEIVQVCHFLRAEQGFLRLSGITAVDWTPADPRFELVYLLHSIQNNQRVRLKCWVSESNLEVESVCSVWRAANWYEREIFDMFGISFRNHPDLRRLMMPADWEGHPLRKDYPVHGHKYSYQSE